MCVFIQILSFRIKHEAAAVYLLNNCFLSEIEKAKKRKFTTCGASLNRMCWARVCMPIHEKKKFKLSFLDFHIFMIYGFKRVCLILRKFTWERDKFVASKIA